MLRLTVCFVALLLWHCNLVRRAVEGGKPSAFRNTLPRPLHAKLAHCDALPDGPQTILCEILAAFDSQGCASNIPSTNPIPPSNSTCRYRAEAGHRMHRYASPPAPSWDKVLDAYLSMHRRCAALDFADLSETYYAGRTPNCRYVVWGAVGNGLGNRVMGLVSAFLYAVLTQRVFLISYPPWNRLFCEPFGNIPAQIELDWKKALRYHWFLDAGCNDITGAPPLNPSLCEKTTIVRLDVVHHTNKSEMEFAACRSGVYRLRDVPFVMFPMSNQYFLPTFFLNPDFEPLLDVLFPYRNPFHVISRMLMNPSDEVWERVRRYADGALAGATRRMGAQIREFRKGVYSGVFDPQVIQCIRHKAGLAPAEKRRNFGRSDYFSVYVASLNATHLTRISEMLVAVREETGKEFRVVAQELDGTEKHDLEHQQEALVDMWVLSQSDLLMTSRSSTFGYVAHALGNLVPFHMQGHGDGFCESGATSDPCYHYPPWELTCKGSPAVGDLLNTSAVVGRCMDRHGAGMEVVMQL